MRSRCILNLVLFYGIHWWGHLMFYCFHPNERAVTKLNKIAFIKSRFCVWGYMFVKIQLSVNRSISMFSSMQVGSEKFAFMSKLDRKWHISSLAFRPFSWNHLKSLTHWLFSYIVRSVIINITCNIYIIYHKEHII